MEYKKFYSDFLQATLHGVVINGDKPKDVKKCLKLLRGIAPDASANLDKEEIANSKGWCIYEHPKTHVIIINTDQDIRIGPEDSPTKTLHHECKHFMHHELQSICQQPTPHHELEYRLSDWAFRKISSMDYFQGLLK